MLFKPQDSKQASPSTLCAASERKADLDAGNYIIISDIAIGVMLLNLAVWIYQVGFHTVWSLYFVPWLVRPRLDPFHFLITGGFEC